VELVPEVRVTVLSPGYMETGFDEASGFRPNAATKLTALAPSTVARIGLDALLTGESSIVAGMRTSSRSCWDAFFPEHSWHGSSTIQLANGTRKGRVAEPLEVGQSADLRRVETCGRVDLR